MIHIQTDNTNAIFRDVYNFYMELRDAGKDVEKWRKGVQRLEILLVKHNNSPLFCDLIQAVYNDLYRIHGEAVPGADLSGITQQAG